MLKMTRSHMLKADAIAPVLLGSIFSAFVLCWAISTLRGFESDEASRRPFTFAFNHGEDHYSSKVNSALALLQPIEPEDVAYLRQHHVPIYLLPGSDFHRHFPAPRDRHARALSTIPEGRIYINVSALPMPIDIAAGIAHEATHLRDNDPRDPSFLPPSGVSLLSKGDEDQATITGDHVWKRLGTQLAPPDAFVCWLRSHKPLFSLCIMLLCAAVMAGSLSLAARSLSRLRVSCCTG